MAKLIFTPDELKKYFSGDSVHRFHTDAKKMADDWAVHFDGEFPAKLLMERRPNEPEEIYKYRETIFEPKTKPTMNKVLQSLQKIRRSADWVIRYPQEKPTKIAEDETLEVYCEQKFPAMGSVTNWAFAVLIKKYLSDPNAVVLVMPKDIGLPENEYLKPIPILFGSDLVIDYSPGDYAVLKNPTGSVYQTKSGRQNGKSFYTITTQTISRHDQINARGDMAENLVYNHALGVLPVYQLGAVVADSFGNEFLWESRISGMLPELNEAIREYSDLQAAKVMHIYPERWEYTNHECRDCKGTGRRKNEVAGRINETDCDSCGGRGYKVAGPYSKIMVRPLTAMENSGGGSAIPTPPAGYVEKDIEIVKVQEESINKHIHDALAAINFEFLMKSPTNQSGYAKDVDKDELNNTVHSIAEDIVRIMDWIYEVIAKYRYRIQYSDVSELLPSISVPEKFDILSATHMESQIKAAKETNVNSVIRSALELQYSNKVFNNDPGTRAMVELVMKLDPLAGVDDEQKMVRLSNKGITRESYVISSNIVSFVQQAIEQDSQFPEKPIEQQRAKMVEMAREMIALDTIAIPDMDDDEGIAGGPDGKSGNQLAQSVGGLTGMIEIAKAVASGVYDLDAAVALVSSRFGISEDEARRQLGTPSLGNDPQQIEKVQKLTT